MNGRPCKYLFYNEISRARLIPATHRNGRPFSGHGCISMRQLDRNLDRMIRSAKYN